MNINDNQTDALTIRPTSLLHKISHILQSLFMNGIVITICSVLPIYMTISHSRSITKTKIESSLRYLNGKDNNEITKPSMKDIYDYEYTFLNNITLINYVGQWKNMKINNQSFLATNDGVGEIKFSKIINKHYVFSHDANNSFNVYFFIKEGKYIDHCLEGNFSLSFTDNFINDLHYILLDNSSQNQLSISATNISIDLNDSQLFYYTHHYINSTNITLSFEKRTKYLKDSFNEIIITPFALANLTIRGDFTIDIQTEIHLLNEIEEKVRNYSFILTVFSFIDIYLVFKLVGDVNDNIQIGLNLDLITIVVSSLYKSLIATAHFYLSLTINNEEMSYEYGIPSLFYFLSFSAFELRLLIYSWKARNINILFTNPNLFRRKMFIFYSLFYVAQFLSLISIKIIFSQFWNCLILYLCTWTFQIIHSIRTGTRPPMSNKYILLSTMSKLFLPVYLKAYDGNAFELRPSYLKVSLIVVFVLIQMTILIMQKRFGAKFIVPKCWKTIPYDYYRKTINVDEHISQNPTCVICLENLKEEEGDLEENKEKIIVIKPNETKGIKAVLERVNNYFQSLSTPLKRQTYMITPCDHIYHSGCLETWMNLKNECPYCKRSIPPLE